MNRVLFIAYCFPPIGGVASIRAAKFTRYLPACGWCPTILTVRNGFYDYFDEELLGVLPRDVEVCRIRSIEIPTPRRLLGRAGGDKESERSNPGSRLAGKASPLFRKLKKQMLPFPDPKIGWLPFALRLGRSICRKANPHLIFATANPYTDLLIGYLLSRKTGLPLVVELRDAWAQDPEEELPNFLHRALAPRFERRVLGAASRIITVTDVMREELRSAYPDIPAERFEILTNGYDPEDFIPAHSPDDRPPNPQCTIAYAGLFYSSRSPRAFLMALRNLCDHRPDLGREFRVRLIGPENRLVKGWIARWGLEPIVECVGAVPYFESIRMQKEADFLLLFLGTGAQGRRTKVYTGKLFEYMAARRPILALAPDGIASSLIEENNLGLRIAPDDVKGIERALLEVHARWKAGHVRTDPPSEFLERFDLRRITRQMGGLFDQVIAEREGGKEGWKRRRVNGAAGESACS